MSRTLVHPFTIFHNGTAVASVYVPLGEQSFSSINQITDGVDQLPKVPSRSWITSYPWKILVLLILALLLVAAIIVPLLVIDLTRVSSTTTSTATDISIVYSQSLSGGVTPSSQCSSWTSFQSLLVTRSYSSLTISGSNDPIGITLTNGTIVAAIANALQTNTAFSAVSSNGYSWAVGTCGSGLELTATGGICGCSTGYTVRPCIGNINWGGINSVTCSAASQTLLVTFQ